MRHERLITRRFKEKLLKAARQTPNKSYSEVFSEKHTDYINDLSLFIFHFDYIPNLINESEINCRSARKWFEEKYADDVTDIHYSKVCFVKGKASEIDDIFYFLSDDLIVDFDTNNSKVRFLFRKTPLFKVEEIVTGVIKFRKRNKKTRASSISILRNAHHGISTQKLAIIKPKLSVQENYNDDFTTIHNLIYKRLSRKNDKGIVLLHGKPGTGKTSYIRFLITSLKKEIIFLPPNMADVITSPNFISVLIENPNSILVIEDAENIVVDRNQDGNSPVSALLNIADGLLSDCLNIQIICSFNTDISKIDPALMRKGRLIAKYEFNELTVEKAQQLSDKLGFNTNIHEPMTLTAIYNQEEMAFEEVRRKMVGFQSSLVS